ncbi:MAG: response regulator [Oscillatoria sp. SIO1A7]|nr:response regulator [Oscillatoria sp. SIO1A7]
MRILLVEDDEAIAKALTVALSHQNYVLDLARDGIEGADLAEAFTYDLILMDVGLPKLDGIGLCKRLRNSGYRMPILLVTARDSTEDKVLGLDAGADDYIVKPFEIKELTARIRALLRRGNAARPPVLEWGSLQLDPSTCSVTYENSPVTMTPTEYRLLELFLRNSTRTYSRRAILEHLWSYDDPPAEETIRAHIKGLRQKLKAAGAPANLIETVYGLGYRLGSQSTEKKKQPKAPSILMAGKFAKLAAWLEQRLGKILVKVVATGDEALQQLKQPDWSLLIVDAKVREPAAMEALGRLQGWRSKVPVIYCWPKVTDSEKLRIQKQQKILENEEPALHLFAPLDRELLASQIAKQLALPFTEIKETIKKADKEPQEDSVVREKTRVAIAEVWERFKGRISDRVATLAEASRRSIEGYLNQEECQDALKTAHKLAGSLGIFGFANGSEIAKQIENILQKYLDQMQNNEFQDIGAILNELVDNLMKELNLNGEFGSQQLSSSSLSYKWQGEDREPLDRPTASPVTLQELESYARERGDRLATVGEDYQEYLGKTAIAIEPISCKESDCLQKLPELLIVDAERELAERLMRSARRMGMLCSLAKNQEEVREAIATKSPQVVLLDLSFSGSKEDGFALLAELTNRIPPVPVLVLTAAGNVQDRLEVAKLGGRAFLQKPVSEEKAIETVLQVLQRAETKTARVMVVDDDPASLFAVQNLLEPWGLKSIALSDPEKFWETLEATRPDLLILDVEMPKIDGISLCQIVRNDPRFSGLPTIFLTARTDAETIHRVFAAGADDYASKPITGPDLVVRVLNRLERSQLLRAKAETDALTGVANRHKSSQELSRFLELASKAKQPLCFAILDLDSLKAVNDKYSHDTGDAVLRRFGRLLTISFCSEDMVARWGGDEFVVFMYGMTKDEGAKRLLSLQETLRQQQFGDAESEFTVTFSAGVAQYPEDGTDSQSLYRAADFALDRAKTAGGDRVFTSPNK